MSSIQLPLTIPTSTNPAIPPTLELPPQWGLARTYVHSVFVRVLEAKKSASACGAEIASLKINKEMLIASSAKGGEWIQLIERRAAKAAQLTQQLAQLSIDITAAEEKKNSAAAKFGEATQKRKTAQGAKKTELNKILPTLQQECSSSRDRYERLLMQRETLSSELETADRQLKSAREAGPQILFAKEIDKIDHEITMCSKRLEETCSKVNKLINRFVDAHIPTSNQAAVREFFIQLGRPSI